MFQIRPLKDAAPFFSGDVTKKFKNVDDYSNEKADLSMSLDVIYHLVEDAVFDAYMYRLFDSSERYVIVYSSNDEKLNHAYGGYHVKHRNFTAWILANAPGWALMEVLPNMYPFDELNSDSTSLADFYFFKRQSS